MGRKLLPWSGTGCREMVLHGLAHVYLWAFGSNYVQWRGLFGADGLIPVGSWIGDISSKELARFPEIIQRGNMKEVVFVKYIAALFGGMDVDIICEMLCLIGIAISGLVVVFGGRNLFVTNPISFFALWFCYLSLVQVGHTFLSFQWDILLLETGFIGMFYAFGTGNETARWSVRFILFKLMYMAGVVKVQSQCPTWLNLTALDYHYATQCIPSPLAWYAAQVPKFINKASVAATLVIEIPLAFWIISPFRIHRQVCFLGQVLLQVLIISSGNYNFFNLLTILLCFTLIAEDSKNGKEKDEPSSSMDIDAFERQGPVFWFISLKRRCEDSVRGTMLIFLVGFGATVWYVFAFMLEPVFDMSNENFPFKWIMSPQLLQRHVHESLWPVFVYSMGMLGVCMAIDVTQGVREILQPLWSLQFFGVLKNMAKFATTIFVVVVVGCTCVICFIPLASLDNQNESIQRIVPEAFIKLYMSTDGVTYPYGLFRRMTGVGPNNQVARPEIVFEIKLEGKKDWEELEFRYKPGNVSRPPPFVAPYQPRLDWQMWFAALSSYQHAPWTVQLAQKILDQSPDVMELIRDGPLDGNVEAVRAFLYHYDFTHDLTSKDWWRRKPESKREYLPPIGRNDVSVAKFIESHGWNKKQQETSGTNNNIKNGLDTVRGYVQFPIRVITSSEGVVALAVIRFSSKLL